MARHVVFARDLAGRQLTDVYVVGIDGSSLHRITVSRSRR
jgi:hypothetical protein